MNGLYATHLRADPPPSHEESAVAPAHSLPSGRLTPSPLAISVPPLSTPLRPQVEQPFRTMPLWQLCHLCQLNVEEALCAPEMPLRNLKPSKASAAVAGRGARREVGGERGSGVRPARGVRAGTKVGELGGGQGSIHVLVSSLAEHLSARAAAPRRRCLTR